ncbi:Rrf2 family transcriptional regulator [Candidatus Woesearchaeota archaeon]|nr:Rrf2 family transcriptional regulator [Candidatus Woesearchaeota archaeon]
MLIPEKLNALIRILLVNALEDGSSLQLSTLAKKAGVTPAMAKRLVLRLERSEYVTISKGVKVIDPIKLMTAWGYTYSIRELERQEFVAAERPQYIMLKIANEARQLKLKYAFTLFSATEHVSPYVAPSDTHLYILKKDLKRWETFFRDENMLPIGKNGSIICLLIDEEYFEGIMNVRDVNLVSLPQLYADLFSYGGRGVEASKELLNVIMRKYHKYV